MDEIRIARELVSAAWRETKAWQANYERARSLLEAAREEHPRDLVVLTCLGAVLSDLGQHAKAVTCLREAIKLGSRDANTYYNLAVALMNCQKRAEAMRNFKKAESLEPSAETWRAYFDPQGT